MQKKGHKKVIIFGGLLLSVVGLAGCLQSTSPKEPFALDICNEYVAYMQCMVDSPEVGYTIEDVEGLISAWQDIEDAQVLESACTIALSQAVQDMKDFKSSCEVPVEYLDDDIAGVVEDLDLGAENEESLDETDDGEDVNTPDQDIIDAISGQTNTSGTDVRRSIENNEDIRTSSRNPEDEEIVGAVIQNILATTYP